jgi:ribosomal protein L44E
MTQHFTRATVSASFYCGKCSRFTQHRIDSGRKGPCLECIERLEEQHAAAPPKAEEKQRGLFDGAA